MHVYTHKSGAPREYTIPTSPQVPENNLKVGEKDNKAAYGHGDENGYANKIKALALTELCVALEQGKTTPIVCVALEKRAVTSRLNASTQNKEIILQG